MVDILHNLYISTAFKVVHCKLTNSSSNGNYVFPCFIIVDTGSLLHTFPCYFPEFTLFITISEIMEYFRSGRVLVHVIVIF